MTRKSNDGGKGRSTGRPGRGAPRSEGRSSRSESGFKPRAGKGPSKGPGKGPAKGRSEGFKPRSRASESGEGRKEWFETRGEGRGDRFEKRGEGRGSRNTERGERRFTGEGRAFGPQKDFGKRPPRRDFSEGRETGDLKPWEENQAPREKRREDGGGFRARREDMQRSSKGGRTFGRDERGRDTARDPSKRVSKRDFKPKSDFNPETPKPAKVQHERIAKVMARAGLCSRREAEEWIEAGRVSVNGEVLTSPALDVSDRDTILVDGKPLPTRERTRLFLYHKPRGLVTTAWDPEGRPTVFQNLPQGLPRVVTIGRLDINTEGLLLLTNDGGLARVISLPDTGWLRRYRVRAYGNITQPDLDALRAGIEIDGMRYGPIDAELQREQGDNVWLTLGLREGKNREVKRVLEHLGLQVNRLIRISFGPFQLGDLEDGAVEEVKTRVLQEQLGPELSAEAQCDFEAPVFVYGDEDDFRPRKRDFPEDKRGARGGRFDKRARRNEESEEEERPRPPRRSPLEIKTSVWRADDPDLSAERRRAPRRGADAKQDRRDTGAMEHKREGRVTSRKGKTALVERVVRAERPRRRDDEFDARPRRDRADGEPRERRGSAEGRGGKSFGAKGKNFAAGRDFNDKAPRGKSEGRSERGEKSFSKSGEKSARRGAARAAPGGRGYSGSKGSGGKGSGGKGFGSKGPDSKGPRGGKPGGRSGGGKPGGRSGGAPRGRR